MEMTTGQRDLLRQQEAGEPLHFPNIPLRGYYEGDALTGSFAFDKQPKHPHDMTPKERDRYLDTVLKRWAKNAYFEGVKGTRVSIAVAVEKGLPLEVNEWPAECAP